VVASADGVGGRVQQRAGVLGEGLAVVGLPVGLVVGVGPVSGRAGQRGHEHLCGQDAPGLFQQVAVEVVAGGLRPAGFIVGVVGAAEQVNGCCIAGLETGFGLVVAVDEGLAEGGGALGAVPGPCVQRAAQGVGGRQLQGSLAVAAFDCAADRVG